ncbi:MAG TPA: hypothetical protein VL381_05285 [Rhodocyclaceae bacterium]|jgi:hypothetical protein|nr:hypothetical protein [Rhodocyclaceae bacterium]
MGIRCLKLAVLYALIGIGFGVYMGASHDFSQKDTHAHANLVGWVSLAVMGLIYIVVPNLAKTRLASAHFWLHNLGLPPMLLGVFLIYKGQMALGEPITGISSTIVALAFVCFAINVWQNAGKAA